MEEFQTLLLEQKALLEQEKAEQKHPPERLLEIERILYEINKAMDLFKIY